MEQIYVQTEDLSVGYHGKVLLSDIALKVKKGEILVLIGPNGAGKSTIIKNIIREMNPIGGNIYVKGRKISDFTSKEYAKTMSVVLTEKIKTEMMTCRDVVAMGRYPYTNYFGKLTPEDERIVDESLESVAALDIAEKDFSQISDGQRQRIMLARAICQKPQIIVLDEPTSFLDIRHKIELLDILQNMAVKENVTVVLSLHEIELANRISDWVMCVRADGKILYGTPDEIFKDEIIRELYDIKNGSYNCLYGSTELEKKTGTPKVFVAGGGGFGVSVYRRLQHFEIPFSAGIIAQNDCEYTIAESLAVKVISEKPFEIFSGKSLEMAKKYVDIADYYIDAGCPYGIVNEKMKELRQYALKNNKIILDKPNDYNLRQIGENIG